MFPQRTAKFFPALLYLSLLLPAANNVAFATPVASVARETPTVQAPSWMLVQEKSTEAIAGQNMDQRRQPASLTKLMTAYVVLDAIKRGEIAWSDTVTVSNEDISIVAQDETRMYLRPGQNVQVRDLVAGLIIISANDAANVLARRIGGSLEDFSVLMNTKAYSLGMLNSHFITPSGISVPGHYSTARDLALLAQRMTTDFPEYYRFSSQQEFAFAGYKNTSKNKLLGMGAGVDGLKTGHTREAGWCIVATARRSLSKTKPKQRLFVILLGEPTSHQRILDAKRLLDFGFMGLQ